MGGALSLPVHTAADPLARHHARWRRRLAVLAVLAMLAICGVALDLSTGPSGLPLRQALAALLGSDDVPRTTQVIVWQVRLPVAILALMVGAALGLAGAEMQTVLENPLAEPFTLGVSAAAALGAAVALVLGLSLPGLPPAWGVTANAFVFALAALGLLQLIGRGMAGPDVLILAGIALSFAAGALLSLVQFVASADALQQLVFWTMGSLAAASWPGVAMVALALALCAPFSLRAAWALTALRLGQAQAAGFGVDVVRLRRYALLRVGVLAAAAVSIVGVVGFVGLAAPHIARGLLGEDHRLALPGAAAVGAVLMSLASVLAKTAVGGVLLPVGLVTTLIGLPVFFALILRKRKG